MDNLTFIFTRENNEVGRDIFPRHLLRRDSAIYDSILDTGTTRIIITEEMFEIDSWLEIKEVLSGEELTDTLIPEDSIIFDKYFSSRFLDIIKKNHVKKYENKMNKILAKIHQLESKTLDAIYVSSVKEFSIIAESLLDTKDNNIISVIHCVTNSVVMFSICNYSHLIISEEHKEAIDKSKVEVAKNMNLKSSPETMVAFGLLGYLWMISSYDTKQTTKYLNIIANLEMKNLKNQLDSPSAVKGLAQSLRNFDTLDKRFKNVNLELEKMAYYYKK